MTKHPSLLTITTFLYVITASRPVPVCFNPPTPRKSPYEDAPKVPLGYISLLLYIKLKHLTVFLVAFHWRTLKHVLNCLGY